MIDKITITDNDLPPPAAKVSEDGGREKLVLCDLADDKPEDERKCLPLYCYLILLIPLIGVLGVIWACFQKKYKFLYQLPAAMICILSTFLPLMFLVGNNEADPNWKSNLARKARAGVVIIEIEEKGWFSTETGIGTGVVVAKIDNTALILTNRHVVFNSKGRAAKRITAFTSSGEKLAAEVVASPVDPDVDMALLCVGNAKSLTVLGDIGKFESLKTGDEVVAIGHPSGLSFTMTQGIVSALRKNMLIQSSASINPGNSGGPLLDSKGRIIGINTFFIKDTQGLNFAFRADFILKRSAWNYSKDIHPILDKITLK